MGGCCGTGDKGEDARKSLKIQRDAEIIGANGPKKSSDKLADGQPAGAKDAGAAAEDKPKAKPEPKPKATPKPLNAFEMRTSYDKPMESHPMNAWNPTLAPQRVSSSGSPAAPPPQGVPTNAFGQGAGPPPEPVAPG